jgi:threonine dehydratase
MRTTKHNIINRRYLAPEIIKEAYDRISPYIHRTPLLVSSQLNEWLGHDIIFKVEGFQKTGAFKIRGALNTLLSLKEQGSLPEEVVTFSSGNHAQAVALASQFFGIKSTVYMAKHVSAIKKQATAQYGANVVLTENRQEAERRTAEMEQEGAYFIHPFDNDMVIAGQGTSCYEALQEGISPTAIFAPCGGGGLLSGTYLAKELLAPKACIFAGEPTNANDAARSCRGGTIVKYTDTPDTLADGASSLSISERTFHYLKQLNGFYEISETDIMYWTQWLSNLLKTTVEPTSAVAMAAAHTWLQSQAEKQRVLVILSGGNIAPKTHQTVWKNNYLEILPCMHKCE